MGNTAVVTLQPVWDCRWSRLRYPVNRATDAWVCVHDGVRREIDAEECGTCPHWELSPGAAASASFATAAAVTQRPMSPTQALRVSARALMLLSAVVLLVCGFVILTRPLAIPFTIALWLGAAALTGFAVFTRLADN